MQEVKSGEPITIENSGSSEVYWEENVSNTLSQYSNKNKDIRNFFWSYPSFLIKLFNVTKPFSFLIFYFFLSLHIFNYFTDVKLIEGHQEVKDTSVVEGCLGQPDNINPLFISENPIEKDLNALIYQKFIEIDEQGKPQPSIAAKWKTENHKKYVFTLKRNLKFHDGEVITADDVVYTFNAGKSLSDRGIDSIGIGLENVKIKAISKYQVEFMLPEVNSTFFEAISVYILPEHYFNAVEVGSLYSSRLSKKPIGSGPYKVQNFDENRIILEASEYYEDPPKIKTYEWRFFNSYESLKVAYHNNLLGAVSHLDYYANDFRRTNSTLNEKSFDLITRKKVIFMNTREDLLQNSSLRKALNYIVNKDKLLRNINVKGDLIYGPINKESWAYTDQFDKYKYNIEQAENLLFQAGYVKNKESGYYQDKNGKILSINFYYLDNELNRMIAEELKNQFEEFGIVLNIEEGAKNYDVITREVIATRGFELLLYEIEVTLDPDQYNLWHSLKVSYPNLNLVGETEKSERMDILLERARMTHELDGDDGRKRLYRQFQKYLMSDSPVIFLYRPTKSYFLTKEIEVDLPTKLKYYHNRFDNIEDWEYANGGS